MKSRVSTFSAMILLGCLLGGQAEAMNPGSLATDHPLQSADLVLTPSSTGSLTISLSNPDVAIRGIEFLITLPEGMTFHMADNGQRYAYQRGSRLSKDYVINHATPAGQPAQVSKVMVYSFGSQSAISPGQGEVLTLPIDVPAGCADGYYQVSLSDIILGVTSTERIDDPLSQSQLTVSTYALGDADTNGRVEKQDASVVASHILGNTPSTFSPVSADANNDASVDVADIVTILDNSSK